MHCWVLYLSCHSSNGNVTAGPASVTSPNSVLLHQVGCVRIGSGLAIVPFLYKGVVQQFGWLDERQFLDAVAVAMITRACCYHGGFIGYLVEGLPGAIVAAIGIFLPYIFLPSFRPHGSSTTR
jgi:chromate transporter